MSNYVENVTGVAPLAEGTSRVDREKGIIRGVKFLGYESKNGYKYRKPDPSLYERTGINLNHPGFLSGVRVQDRWGVAVAGSIKVTSEGVFGDVQYNPHHEATESILWWAENNPDKMGMSHVAEGRAEKVGDDTYITVTRVESVDLVVRPATTKGFHEENKMDFKKDYEEALARATAAEAALKDEKAARALAEQKLSDEQKAHSATKAATLREGLIAEAGLTDLAPALKESILEASTDEKAKALITAVVESRKVTGAPRSGASPKPAEGDDKPKVKTFEELKAEGAFSFKG